VQEIRINYSGGRYYNGRPGRFGPRGPRPRRSGFTSGTTG
jgi:hypothetical protein